MTPAPLGRVVLGAAILSTFAIGMAAAVHATPSRPAPSSAGIRHHASYVRLLTAPLHRTAPGPTLESARHTSVAKSTPCTGNSHRQLVLVSIEHQHLWTCAGDHVQMSTPVTTGRTTPGDATPRGDFAVEARLANTTLHPASGSVIPVAYWIPFKDNLYGFHNAPWQSMPFGDSNYRTEGSIGCVHVPLDALRQLFDWVHVGTTVRIR